MQRSVSMESVDSRIMERASSILENIVSLVNKRPFPFSLETSHYLCFIHSRILETASALIANPS
jgi:hypothetical protein